MRPLCIYHGNCADGFTAAWIVNRYFQGEVDFHAGVYQKDPPDVRGRDLIIVDFSYKRSVMLEIAKSANSVLVLDHHKTAMEDLAPLSPGIGFDHEIFPITHPSPTWFEYEKDLCSDRSPLRKKGEIWTLFDMERSGAGLTWDFFNPGVPRPKFVNHVEDRDLWRFALPGTREIQANVFSYEYTFENWDKLESYIAMDADEFAIGGEAIERKHLKDIRELVDVTRRKMRIGGHIVPVANLPYTMTSDAGNLMAEEAPAEFAACYMDKPEGRYFSLRSLKGGRDVGEIAKQYGGGGHANAAGFTVPYDQLTQFEP